MKLKNIKCQATHSKDGGCYACGGFKKVLEVRKCGTCGHECLVRPGAYTSYPGKVWMSFDGVEITDGSGTDYGFCSKCPDQAKKEKVL